MDISLINSQPLLRLLNLTERKEELLKLIEEIDAAIIQTLQGGVSVEVIQISSASAKPASKPAVKALPKPDKAKGKMSPAGRARISSMMKARWAARKAGKSAANVGRPAKSPKKGFKLPKKA